VCSQSLPGRKEAGDAGVMDGGCVGKFRSYSTHETRPLLFQISINFARRDVMNSSFVVTFTNKTRHVFGLGDMQRWEREGIRGRCFKGKILKGDVKGGQLRVPSLLTPSRICGMGWDFFETDRNGGRSVLSHSKTGRISFLFRSKFIKKSKFIKDGSVSRNFQR
jgi:hypothetical protein